jgi:penicillin amidase
VNYIDVTDVYQETVVTCDDGKSPCVTFNGAKVALQQRLETINIGRFGDIIGSKQVVLWDVPQHGPIIPRITADHQTEALAAQELSIKYTGHQPAPKLASVLWGLDTARTVKDAVAAVDSGFLYGNQNWVIGDDQGHIGWTQYTRTPRRSASAAPWKVLPGDGSAEWGGDLDPIYIPHAYDPPQGFIATANNDPIGVTDDNDPFFDEPKVDGLPLYLGADYDPGTRVGRITRRIRAATANGGKLGIDDLQSIQADAVDPWASIFLPTAIQAAQAFAEEMQSPGSHPEISQLVAQADVGTKSLVNPALALLQGWTSFDTPSGAAEEQPSAQAVTDSEAATIFNVWLRYFADDAIGDEIDETLMIGTSSFSRLRTLTTMVQHPEKMVTGLGPSGDALLFSLADETTPMTRLSPAAKAIADALGYLQRAIGTDIAGWQWGKLHTLTLQFLAPLDALQIPLKTDPQYPSGFPRHGTIGTVDAGGDSINAATGDYSYDHGPAIRFACELDPKKGPIARNVLPGGEILDPNSPHYRDQLELWRKNKSIDLVFGDGDVAVSAKKEQMTNGLGRIHFAPK